MKFIFSQSKVGRFLSTQALLLLDPDSGYTREGEDEGGKTSHRPTETCPRLKCIRSPDDSFSCYHGKGDGLVFAFLSGLGFHFYCLPTVCISLPISFSMSPCVSISLPILPLPRLPHSRLLPVLLPFREGPSGYMCNKYRVLNETISRFSRSHGK